MIRLLGKCLLFAGCAGLGAQHAWGLRRRVDCLAGFRGALEILERELAFSAPPVAVLLARMEEGSGGQVRAFFAQCARRFAQEEGTSWGTVWRDCLTGADLPLRGEDKRLLAEAAGVLGKYDEESQRQAVAALLGRLEDRHAAAREEAARMGRVYGTLGVAGGLFCCLLL